MQSLRLHNPGCSRCPEARGPAHSRVLRTHNPALLRCACRPARPMQIPWPPRCDGGFRKPWRSPRRRSSWPPARDTPPRSYRWKDTQRRPHQRYLCCRTAHTSRNDRAAHTLYPCTEAALPRRCTCSDHSCPSQLSHPKQAADSCPPSEAWIPYPSPR